LNLTQDSNISLDGCLPSESDDSSESSDCGSSDDEFFDEDEALSLIDKLNDLCQIGVANAWILVESKQDKDKLCSNGYFYI
jgi:hypothetical protein